jgi:hypothetical protein
LRSASSLPLNAEISSGTAGIEFLQRYEKRSRSETMKPTQQKSDYDYKDKPRAKAGKSRQNVSPSGQPHGTTEDQINEMESEGQAAKPGQDAGAGRRGDPAPGATR